MEDIGYKNSPIVLALLSNVCPSSRELISRTKLNIVRSLNAKFEPDRDKADKSAKLCIQFPWDMSMKSEMGAQEKKLPVTV